MLEVTECPKCETKDDKPFTVCPKCGVNAEAYIGVMTRKKEVAKEQTVKKRNEQKRQAIAARREDSGADVPVADGINPWKQGAAISSNKRESQSRAPDIPFKSHGDSIQSILQSFLRRRIGINYDDATKSKPAKLVAAASDHFSVVSAKTGLIYHFPYSGITGLVEGASSGVKSGLFFGFEADIFISVYHQVVYKGAVGFGFGIPLGGGD